MKEYTRTYRLLSKAWRPSLIAALFVLILLPQLVVAQGVTPTNEWVNFYGTNSTLNGAPVPVGAVIVAYDPTGVVCGSVTVSETGSYGLLPCYRDDPETPADEGAVPGDGIHFTINGIPATTQGPDSATWTRNGDLKHVELSAGAAAPTNTPTPTGTPIPAGVPEWVNLYGTASTLDGAPLPTGAVVSAYDVNGVQCGSIVVTAPGEYGLLACMRDDPGTPADEGANPGEPITLYVNGRAATPLGPDSPVWTVNGARLHVELRVGVAPPTATPTPTETPPAAPEWVNFWGNSSVFMGQALPVGAVVVAYDSGGTECGRFVVHSTGQYGYLACQSDDPSTSQDEGANPGETIHFTVNGVAAIALGPDAAIWTANGDRKHVELNVPMPTPTPTPTWTPVPTATPTPTLTWTPVPTATPTPTSEVPQPTATPTATPTQPPAPTATPTDTPTQPPAPTATPTATPTQPPAPTATPTATPSAGGGCAGFYYTVKPGDTLYLIAIRFGTTVSAIMACNDISNPNWIYVGQRLLIPYDPPDDPPAPTTTPTSTSGGGGESVIYYVKRGDNLYLIARRFGSTVNAIVAANGLRNPNYIWVGQRLVIPTGGGGSPPPGDHRYRVQPGDTLWRIGNHFGVSPWTIAAINGISYPYVIYVGQILIVP